MITVPRFGVGVNECPVTANSKNLKLFAHRMRRRAATRRFPVRRQVSFRMTSPEPQQPPSRRRTDSDGNDALRAAHRAIAEHAYRLFAEGGFDRSRIAEYWGLAEQAWVDHAVKQTIQKGRA